MCGIIGYLGDREATPILMESLKRLEYRGYDSAGGGGPRAPPAAPPPPSTGRPVGSDEAATVGSSVGSTVGVPSTGAPVVLGS